MTATAEAIRMFDYVEQFAAIEDEILAAVRDVLASGSLILGPRVRAFEDHFARFLGVDGHSVGVASGTDALAIALRALGVGAGDEVIAPANTAVPTASAICMAGARPIFCDVDPHTLLMDLADFESRVTPRTKAVIPVHLFGNAVDMPRLLEIAARHRLRVVEDCAQACGTTLAGRHVGTFGDVGCFSFYPTKNLGAYGDAGLCFSRHADLAESMRQIRVYGRGASGDAERQGVNSRLDELQAAILDVKLGHLPAWLAGRRGVAAAYHKHLAAHIARPRVAGGVDHSYHLFVISTPYRDRLVALLEAADIGYGIHYPAPLHRMPAFHDVSSHPPSLPVAEKMARQILSLPCYPELSPAAVRRVCAVVNECLSAEC